MPIIRITAEHIEQANAARKAALERDPEYRVFEERLELLRQAQTHRREHGEEPPEGPTSVPAEEREP